MQSPAKIANLEAHLEYEAPNSSLYTFEGTLTLKSPHEAIPVRPDQVLLRGSSLRNTDWIVGLVIFAGHDSKMMRNAKPAPIKRSRMEKMVNKQILAIFALLFCMATTSLVGFLVWSTTGISEGAWYLSLSPSVTPGEGTKQFVIFVVMFNTVVPISLYVTIEFVKLLQAYFINNDTDMYYKEGNIPAVARTSNLNEELGQVDFVFTDKTGTLTQNQMCFKRCSIAGICYGTSPSSRMSPLNVDSSSASAPRSLSPVTSLRGDIQGGENPSLARNVADPSFDFWDPALLSNLREGHGTASTIEAFLTALAVCHTVVLENHPVQHDRVEYRASSPDEVALVSAAKYLQFPFLSRKPAKVLIGSPSGEREYELLDTIEFDSDRKRMSVVVRTPEGKLVLFCKGADSIILERLGQDQPITAETTAQLKEFGEEGLRTLCIARKTLTEEEYAVIVGHLEKLSNALSEL